MRHTSRIAAQLRKLADETESMAEEMPEIDNAFATEVLRNLARALNCDVTEAVWSEGYRRLLLVRAIQRAGKELARAPRSVGS